MPTLLRLLPLVLLVVCLGQPLPARADTVQVFAHLFIVPATLADGSEAAPRVPDFEAWLAETFGGYTRLGAGAGGWKNETGQIETEVNTTYLTTAGRDCSKDIAARLVQEFGMRVPYVLVLPAGAFAARSR
ncbi:hypothetical protein [Desulfovibrio sp. TomC]|uniref:hypothetical protein n=1 Tax=Desulfovibrio sp. TomC TaxID=1562888 RepID=UPI0005749DC6|nr:hypothetical protein [Desulfovibrio sp. TomC]KHK02506.1 hypothetical protein NY78_2264 [Desulfovibrio sp. TomC]